MSLAAATSLAPSGSLSIKEAGWSENPRKNLDRLKTVFVSGWRDEWAGFQCGNLQIQLMRKVTCEDYSCNERHVKCFCENFIAHGGEKNDLLISLQNSLNLCWTSVFKAMSPIFLKYAHSFCQFYGWSNRLKQSELTELVSVMDGPLTLFTQSNFAVHHSVLFMECSF